jgi:hypothetical protein
MSKMNKTKQRAGLIGKRRSQAQTPFTIPPKDRRPVLKRVADERRIFEENKRLFEEYRARGGRVKQIPFHRFDPENVDSRDTANAIHAICTSSINP